MHFYALLWLTKDQAWGTDSRYLHPAFFADTPHITSPRP